MDIKQVYEYANTATKEALGETAVLNEDLSNIVDIGTEIFNTGSKDKFVNALVNRIGKVLFVDRVYTSKAPSVLMDGWEYGQVLQKIDSALPEATENETWELQDGVSYDPNVFHAPKVTEKFFDKRVTFEVDLSVGDKQVKGAFESASAMGRFISMLYTKVNNSITLKTDKLILATIASAVAMTYHADIGSSTPHETSGVKAINLLKLYNEASGDTATADDCMTNLAFLKFASEKILETSDHMENYSKLFNVGNTEKFTPKALQKIILLSDFKRKSDVYLQSDTYHNELTKLPDAQIVSYWQGSGQKFEIDDCAKINVKTPQGDVVTIPMVLGTIFDRDALGVCCLDKRVTTNYNGKAEFTNYFYKFEAGYFNDMNENMVVFFVA